MNPPGADVAGGGGADVAGRGRCGAGAGVLASRVPRDFLRDLRATVGRVTMRTIPSVPSSLVQSLACLAVDVGDVQAWSVVVGSVLRAGRDASRDLGLAQRGVVSWSLAPRVSPYRGRPCLPSERAYQARVLLRAGRVARAARRLAPWPDVPFDPRATFPYACRPVPRDVRPGVSTLPLCGLADRATRERVVRESLGVMVDDTAPGPSGVRVSHVMSLWQAPAFRSLFVSSVVACLVGDAPDLLRAVRVTPIPKASGDALRPLGVGEVVSACAKRLVHNPLRDVVYDSMRDSSCYGLMRGACHSVARALQRAHDNGFVVLCLDVSNAFNCVERECVVDAVRVFAPDFVPFVTHSLQPSYVVCPDASTMRVDRGVVQGDPLSATLFALVIAGVMRRVRALLTARGIVLGDVLSEDGYLRAGFYADDGVLVCRPCEVSVLGDVLACLRDQLSTVGLSLKPSGFVCILPEGVSFRSCGAGVLGVSSAQCVPAARVLGVPVGRRVACTRLLMEKVRQVDAEVSRYVLLDSPLCILRMLQCRGPCALLSWVLEGCAKGVVTMDVLSVIAMIETKIVMALFSCEEPVSPDSLYPSFYQCFLPGTLGGLGIPCVRYYGKFHDGVWSKRDDAAFRVRTVRARQALLEMWRGERGTCGVSLVDERRVIEQGQRGGACLKWLWRDVSTYIDPSRDASLERVMLSNLFGVPVHPRAPGVTHRCVAGHDACARRGELPPVLDGSHMLTCVVHVKNQRHNAVRDALYRVMREAHPPSSVEVLREVDVLPDGVLRQRAPGEPGPGDVALRVRGGRPTLIDCVVTAACSMAALPASVDRHPTASAFNAKLRAWQSSGRVSRADFVPFALTSYGSVNPSSWYRVRALLGGGVVGERRLYDVVLCGLLEQAAAARRLRPSWSPPRPRVVLGVPHLAPPPDP